MSDRKESGRKAEQLVADVLRKKGYIIAKMNYHSRYGEIDIIAVDKIDTNELVFIEVKTRKQNLFGSPAEAVNTTKINHIYRVAEYFLMINKLENCFVRFDIIEIYEKSNNKIHINHIKNAISEKTM